MQSCDRNYHQIKHCLIRLEKTSCILLHILVELVHALLINHDQLSRRVKLMTKNASFDSNKVKYYISCN